MNKKLKFEIINPSDEAYIESSFEACCVATLLFSEGKYALRQVGGDLGMPVFLFGGAEKWIQDTFGKTLNELFDHIGIETIKEALLSVHLVRERSSLNDFTSYAHKLANRLKIKQ